MVIVTPKRFEFGPIFSPCATTLEQREPTRAVCIDSMPQPVCAASLHCCTVYTCRLIATSCLGHVALPAVAALVPCWFAALLRCGPAAMLYACRWVATSCRAADLSATAVCL